jgi:outer membrane lipoprotein-sorting protein
MNRLMVQCIITILNQACNKVFCYLLLLLVIIVGCVCKGIENKLKEEDCKTLTTIARGKW